MTSYALSVPARSDCMVFKMLTTLSNDSVANNAVWRLFGIGNNLMTTRVSKHNLQPEHQIANHSEAQNIHPAWLTATPSIASTDSMAAILSRDIMISSGLANAPSTTPVDQVVHCYPVFSCLIQVCEKETPYSVTSTSTTFLTTWTPCGPPSSPPAK